MKGYNNLKIRIYLQSEVITDGFCPLDGVLYYHSVREEMGVQHRSKSLASNIPAYQAIDLPILKINTKSETKDWYYACSFAQWAKSAKHSKTMKTRRFDSQNAAKFVDWGKKKAKVNLKSGQLKNYYITEYTISSPYVDYYCHAVKDHLERLLPFVQHIGKKSSGAVKRIEVQDWHSDWSIRGYDDNKLMRTVPVRNQNAPIYGLRPSYWLPHHQTNVALPDVAFVA